MLVDSFGGGVSLRFLDRQNRPYRNLKLFPATGVLLKPFLGRLLLGCHWLMLDT
jgi:hypothetical protein